MKALRKKTGDFSIDHPHLDQVLQVGTEGETRTRTISLSVDFESTASTNSATPALGI